MTWRRFLVLLSGLGPNSAYVAVRVHREQNPVIEDPQEAMAYLESVFGL